MSDEVEVCQVHSNPDVYTASIPFTNYRTSETNAYFIVSDGECLVVDTGAPTDEGAEVFMSVVEQLGIDLERTKFFLTHLHLDHAGLVDRVVPLSAPVYVSKVDFDFMLLSEIPEFWHEVEAQIEHEGYGADRINKMTRYGMGIKSFSTEGRTLEFVAEGDTIKVGSEEFRVVDTGGHTPGHISLYHPGSGIFFAGDHFLFVISPGLGLRPSVEDPMGMYLANMQKLLDLDISQLFYAHGDLKSQWRERAQWLIDHHNSRIDRAEAYVAQHPGALGCDVVRNLKWNVPCAWEDISDGQMWCIIEGGIIILEHLVKAGRIVRVPDESGVHRYYPISEA